MQEEAAADAVEALAQQAGQHLRARALMMLLFLEEGFVGWLVVVAWLGGVWVAGVAAAASLLPPYPPPHIHKNKKTTRTSRW